ncbi:PPC domain-containing DNA-binding protein [Fuchsiella alkaliacetigena]|uniref:PPC domain-containing DNA-binding protein n=1 Tax=Fuchsiella alkaliacetigena TaxID=957042 RepID=UPI00200A3EF2|nr:PPC domain-containing DNA-binding protein [Fuchsiella alkaliacetigena]MCK8823739.1 DNA-binding protein [Fuchsiella alkaliacetigena]
MLKKYQQGNIYMGRLDYETDLLKELTAIVKDKNIKSGRINVIGAVKKATISFYDQQKKEYRDLTWVEEMEIVNCVGNISLRDGEAIIHAHITLGTSAGKLRGGHLAAGTIVFAAEYIIEEFIGEAFERGTDKVTGLPLWQE